MRFSRNTPRSVFILLATSVYRPRVWGPAPGPGFRHSVRSTLPFLEYQQTPISPEKILTRYIRFVSELGGARKSNAGRVAFRLAVCAWAGNIEVIAIRKIENTTNILRAGLFIILPFQTLSLPKRRHYKIPGRFVLSFEQESPICCNVAGAGHATRFCGLS